MARPSLHDSLRAEQPLQIVGVLNAYVALLAERAGFRALYLSGAGVANASYGLPDLGVTTLDNVLEDASRITAVTKLPLLVDIDTGWGSALSIQRAVQLLERAGVAAVHLEDQIQQKRCGHRPNKGLVDTEEMCDRIRAAVEARSHSTFAVMARTDAFAMEGIEGVVARARAYRGAGATMLFVEALSSLEQYAAVKRAVELPLLANLTEFGKTPLFTVDEMRTVGVDMLLYPLSAARAMYRAAERTLQAIRRDGTQKVMVESMQTRDELYEVLDYHHYEQIYDQLAKRGGESGSG